MKFWDRSDTATKTSTRLREELEKLITKQDVDQQRAANEKATINQVQPAGNKSGGRGQAGRGKGDKNVQTQPSPGSNQDNKGNAAATKQLTELQQQLDKAKEQNAHSQRQAQGLAGQLKTAGLQPVWASKPDNLKKKTGNDGYASIGGQSGKGGKSAKEAKAVAKEKETRKERKEKENGAVAPMHPALELVSAECAGSAVAQATKQMNAPQLTLPTDLLANLLLHRIQAVRNHANRSQRHHACSRSLGMEDIARREMTVNSSI